MTARRRTAAVLAVLGAALAACTESGAAPKRVATEPEMTADQVMYGVNHVMTQNGVRTAVLVSDSAYVQMDSGLLDLLGVSLTFFNEQGQERGKLTSRTGEYDRRTGAMTSRGDVVLVLTGPKPRTIRGEELHFDLQADRIWSEKPVVMTEGEVTVQGSTLESDLQFRNVKLGQGSTSGVPLKGSEGITF